ncbi:4a-hydroxytetrahydrobiopterin dehydratase [soil metagenome]
MRKLSNEELSSSLAGLPGWKNENNSIVKSFKTFGFPQTMALSSAICGFCQQHDHHPDYLTMKYSELIVSFSTHSEGGITDKDIEMAKEIESLRKGLIK